LGENKKSPLTYLTLQNGKRIWQFSIQNRRDLIQYRDDGYYNAGRGHAASNREEAKRKHNLGKTLRRRRKWAHPALKAAQLELDRATLGLEKAKRQYHKAVYDLRRMGFQPKDKDLVRVLSSASVDPLGIETT
jgi:hypothetical protein